MPYETSHRFDSVCVIESLAPPYDLTGTWLYEEVLKPLADREGFMVRHYTANTRDKFFECFNTSEATSFSKATDRSSTSKLMGMKLTLELCSLQVRS